MDLNELRKQIDDIDQQMVDLFVARMNIAAKVAEYKKQKGLPILMPAREQEKIRQVVSQAGAEMEHYVRDLYTTIFALSRSYQEKHNKCEKVFGLLGASLKHTYSPQIHKRLGNYTYRLFEKSQDELEDFLKNGNFQGLNVTIPYKKAVIPYCDALTDEAQTLNAVNTLIRRPDGSLLGHNTDYIGFHAMVKRTQQNFEGKKVLVLGSGGASNTVTCVLKELGANPVVISRTGENHYQNLELHSDAFGIVNTTPVGTYPNTGVSPIDLSLFSRLGCVMDLIYNPGKTKLLLEAERRNIVTENGLYMLVAQAKASAELFTGSPISDALTVQIYRELKKEMENILLIGMAGCGKSTVGKRLSELTGKRFLDTDLEIEKREGMSIPEIFRSKGEEYFRELETQVVSDFGKESGYVIATGGGVVTQRRNFDLLRQNGTVFWIKRNIKDLPTEGRPLSIGADLNELFLKRRPLYEELADYCVSNTGTPEDTALQIIQLRDRI